MGLATIDPRSHEVQRYSRLKMSKLTKKHMAIRMLSDTASGWRYISLSILTFLNRCISIKTSLINTKLGDFVNLATLFLTMLINSCLSHNLQART